MKSFLRSTLPGGEPYRAPRLAPACTTCRRPIVFDAGEAAIILRHVAYGFDFVHQGPCLDAARELLFVEPGYDCQAFGPDLARRRVLDVADAEGWAAASPGPRSESWPAIRCASSRCAGGPWWSTRTGAGGWRSRARGRVAGRAGRGGAPGGPRRAPAQRRLDPLDGSRQERPAA